MRIKKIQERWFPAIDDPDKAEVKIKHLSPGEVQDIQDEAYDREISYVADKDGKFTPNLSFKPQTSLEMKLSFTAAVVGWKNMFDAAGNPLAFNEDNLIRAMREIEGFNEFIIECREKLASDIAEEKKAQEKNS